jgi:hypothetical protein
MAHVFWSSYENWLFQESLNSVNWSAVFVDEVHKIKVTVCIGLSLYTC